MIEYLIPEYVENRGDCCKLKIDGNEKMINSEINVVLRNVYKERCLNLDAIRKKEACVLNQKNVIPLYLSREEILVPVKLRTPRAKGDSVYGFINDYFVDKITNDSIVLKDKSNIVFLESKKVILKRRRMANLVEENFMEKAILKGEMECAATRQDIAIVLMEIEYIKKNMKVIV